MKSNATTKSNRTGAKKKSGNGMPAKPGAAENLKSLFVDELKDIYWAEKALVKAIPKMIKNATSDELITALEEHLDITEQQVTRLEQVFESVGAKAQAKKCEAMEGLIKEAESIIAETREGVVRDAGIISAAQKVEHYEIATYGTLRTFATVLGEEEAADLLQQTLNEEKQADETLTGVAVNSINMDALKAEDGNNEEEEEEEEEGEDNEEEEEDSSTPSKARRR
ncbi:MAG: ferritin-like domain-containing protein [Bacteroidia bacterium]